MDTKLIIEYVPTDSLKPASYNPRIVNAKDFESLQKSIDQFGWAEPICVNKRSGNIVGGHARWQAAKALGLSPVPVIYVDLDDAHERSLNIALNKISGEFDNDMLSELLLDLDADMLELTGFNDDELAALSADPFDEPEAEQPAKSTERKYSTDQLREFAKSYYPDQLQTITGFLAVVDDRA